MEIGTGEADDINAHWSPSNCTITSAADAGGGSTYVGLIVRARRWVPPTSTPCTWPTF